MTRTPFESVGSQSALSFPLHDHRVFPFVLDLSQQTTCQRRTPYYWYETSSDSPLACVDFESKAPAALPELVVVWEAGGLIVSGILGEIIATYQNKIQMHLFFRKPPPLANKWLISICNTLDLLSSKGWSRLQFYGTTREFLEAAEGCQNSRMMARIKTRVTHSTLRLHSTFRISNLRIVDL